MFSYCKDSEHVSPKKPFWKDYLWIYYNIQQNKKWTQEKTLDYKNKGNSSVQLKFISINSFQSQNWNSNIQLKS